VGAARGRGNDVGGFEMGPQQGEEPNTQRIFWLDSWEEGCGLNPAVEGIRQEDQGEKKDGWQDGCPGGDAPQHHYGEDEQGSNHQLQPDPSVKGCDELKELLFHAVAKTR